MQFETEEEWHQEGRYAHDLLPHAHTDADSIKFECSLNNYKITEVEMYIRTSQATTQET